MTNKYELTDEEVEEMYDYMFTQKEQFVHLADPDKKPQLYYVEEELDSEEYYIHALVLFKDNYTSYEMAYGYLSNYTIYDSEDLRNDDFERLVHEQAEDAIENALVEGHNSWLSCYIDTDEVAEDMEADKSYAEVLSSYEEEIKYTVNGTTYYLYRNS